MPSWNRSLWPGGPVCPHCGGVERIYAHEGRGTRIGTLQVLPVPQAVHREVGTVFESSQMPLHKWLAGHLLMCASKKGISAHQLHRTLEVSYRPLGSWRTASARPCALATWRPMGGLAASSRSTKRSSVTTGSSSRTTRRRRGYAHKLKVLALVDRKTGKARTMVVDDLKATTLMPILRRTSPARRA